MEYSERRAAVLGLERLAAPMRLAGRKRRRTPTGWMSVRRLPNASVLDVIPELQEDEMTEDEQTETPGESERKEEEAQLMAVRTVVFGTGLTGDMRPGYKYQPNVLKDVLFPVPSGSTLERPPPRKRRRTTLASEDIIMDGDPAESEPPAPTPNRPVILETPKETYLLSLAHGSEYSPEGRKYDISLILEGEVEEDREDAVVLVVADKNAKAPHETPPPSPPADDEPNEAVPAPSSSDVTIAATATTKPTGDEVQEKSTRDATVFASKSPSPPRTDTQLTDSSKVDTSTTTTAKSLSTKKDSATSPPSLNENVSMADPSASKASVQKTEPPAKKARLKHPVAQVLQRRVGEDMFKFTEEGVSIADGEDGMPTEWLVQVTITPAFDLFIMFVV
ncbi:hypothetical protein AN958_03961 [Leucoagaricus sp. SymC.cos]|nr:hypothetical protein AN958_03961 [Leucoagaricus sp. SymC.cos]